MTQLAQAPRNAANAVSANDAGPTVLVIDDSNLCRELVVAALRGNGYVTLSASDGEAGISQLHEHHVDAVILDNEMPKMDGLTFLRTIRADEKWGKLPIVMLTTNVSREVIVEAMNQKVSGYLVKDRFSMPEMLTRVRSALGRAAPQPPPPASEARPLQPKVSKPPTPSRQPPMKLLNLVKHDDTLAAMAEFKSVRTLPGTMAQIAAIPDSAKTNTATISDILAQDPVVAARVVQQAATTASGSKARLANLHDAVRALGVDAVRDLAGSVEVLKEFPENGANGVGLLGCWQHMLAVAAIASRTVPKSDTVPPGLGLLIGLCHDLPEIVLRQRFPTEFGAAIDFANQAKVPINDSIAAVFGASIAEITSTLFQQLKFPAIIADPIKEFAINADKSIDSHKSLLARSLAISNFIAHGMLFAPSGEAIVAPVSQNDCHTMLIPTSAINFAEIRSETIMAICMRAKIDANAEVALTKNLFNHSNANIWYARHSSFTALDPIEVALKNLANVQVSDRLPQPSEMNRMDGIIILASGTKTPSLPEALRLWSQVGREIPLLQITSASEINPNPDYPPGICEQSHPIALKRLAEFIGQLNLSV